MATLLLGGCGAESSGTVEKMDPASVRERAFRGFSKDQYRMGLYYEDGIHVHADLNNAVRWYQQAMKDGDARSRYRLGLLMWLGRTEGSADVAFNLVQTAAKAGLPEAQVTLGMWYANGVGTAYNRDEALLWFQRAAAEHDTIARYALAKLNRRRHASGTRAPEVVALHEQASRGNVKAQHQLAERYRQGNDVIQDYAEAAFWQKIIG